MFIKSDDAKVENLPETAAHDSRDYHHFIYQYNIIRKSQGSG